MIQEIKQVFKRWWYRLFSSKDIEEALKVKVALSQGRMRDYRQWQSLYEGKAEWNNKDVPSIHIASGVCTELARAVTIEFESEISGGTYAEYLNEQYQRMVAKVREAVEKCCVGGIIILRPFIVNNEIHVTIAENNCFFPLKYNELDEIISVVFTDTIERDGMHYTLLEKCDFEDNIYTIEHTAWVSRDREDLGRSIPLETVPEWANLSPGIRVEDVDRPWFSVLEMPGGGNAIFSKAIEIIKQADKQFGRTLWEFEGGELAVFVPGDMWKNVGRPNGVNPRNADVRLAVPTGKERLFINSDLVGTDLKPEVFSPALRDDSLFRGLNEMLRRIEFICGLSYGVISDPQNVDKTATEIKSSKQRLYQTVCDIQKALENALKALVEIMDDMAVRYGLAAKGDYDVSFFWDDSILKTTEEKQADYDAELKRLLMLEQTGVVSKAEVRAFVVENSDYFSKLSDKTIDEAQKTLPVTEAFPEE